MWPWPCKNDARFQSASNHSHKIPNLSWTMNNWCRHVIHSDFIKSIAIPFCRHTKLHLHYSLEIQIVHPFLYQTVFVKIVKNSNLSHIYMIKALAYLRSFTSFCSSDFLIKFQFPNTVFNNLNPFGLLSLRHTQKLQISKIIRIINLVVFGT
jgi:hypothetical protein